MMTLTSSSKMKKTLAGNLIVKHNLTPEYRPLIHIKFVSCKIEKDKHA